MKKRKYKHQDLLTTTTNLLVAIEQQAILHPYPQLRQQATEATEVLREMRLLLANEDLTKNAALTKIGRYRTKTRGGLAIIPMLRTPITASRLDKDTLVRPLETARELCDVALTAMDVPGGDPHEIACIRWCLRAIDHLEGKLTRVNWPALMEMSKTGVNYPDFPEA